MLSHRVSYASAVEKVLFLTADCIIMVMPAVLNYHVSCSRGFLVFIQGKNRKIYCQGKFEESQDPGSFFEHPPCNNQLIAKQLTGFWREATKKIDMKMPVLLLIWTGAGIS